MKCLGVDCGIHGGAAIVETSTPFDVPQLIDAISLPIVGVGAGRRLDVVQFMRWLQKHDPKVAFVERAQSMPRQGVSSAFLYGRATGAIEAVCVGSLMRLEIVEPGRWKKHFGLVGRGKDADAKELARQRAQRAFPGAPQFERKLDHNRAEAALIALYGAETMALPDSGLTNQRVEA